jgi:hypothetical protein
MSRYLHEAIEVIAKARARPDECEIGCGTRSVVLRKAPRPRREHSGRNRPDRVPGRDFTGRAGVGPRHHLRSSPRAACPLPGRSGWTAHSGGQGLHRRRGRHPGPLNGADPAIDNRARNLLIRATSTRRVRRRPAEVQLHSATTHHIVRMTSAAATMWPIRWGHRFPVAGDDCAGPGTMRGCQW